MSQSPGTFEPAISQPVSIRRPVKIDALAVNVWIWEDIKRKVRQVRDPSNLYFTLGTGMVGVGAAALTTAVVGWLTGQADQANYAPMIWAGVAIIFIVCGICCLHVGVCHRKVTSQRAEDIVSYMESWERSWLGKKAGEAPPDNLGSSGLRVADVTGTWHLTFNPRTEQGKIIDLSPDGSIGRGKNNNEFQWRLRNGLLEFINSAEKVHSRFKYDPQDGRFNSTNDPDTPAFKDQFMVRIQG